MNYELGQFDERAYNHGRSVVDEMRNVTGAKSGVAHFVVIAVYADGYLQFAGADAALGVHFDRLATKQQAALPKEELATAALATAAWNRRAK